MRKILANFFQWVGFMAFCFNAHAQLPPQNMTPRTFTFNCPDTLYFFDPGGIGGDTLCCTSGCSTGDYQNNFFITETFLSGYGNCFSIATEAAPSTFGLCTNDTLKIFDGPNTSFPLLAVFTNTVNPAPSIVNSSQDDITFKFSADATGTARGWHFRITCATCVPASSGENYNVMPLAPVVYPTPFTTQLQIQYSITEPGELVVYDAFGRKAKSCSLPANQKTFQFLLGELPAGIYLVAIYSGGKSFTEKVVKE